MMILDWRNSLEIPPDANISDESIDLIARYTSARLTYKDHTLT